MRVWKRLFNGSIQAGSKCIGFLSFVHFELCTLISLIIFFINGARNFYRTSIIASRSLIFRIFTKKKKKKWIIFAFLQMPRKYKTANLCRFSALRFQSLLTDMLTNTTQKTNYSITILYNFIHRQTIFYCFFSLFHY